MSRLRALLLVPFVAACSLVFDTDRHRGDVDPVVATDFCAQFADIECAGERDCCAEPDFDFEQCLDAAAEQCAEVLAPVGLDPRAGYDARLAGVALAEARALVTTCDPAYYAWIRSPSGVAQTFAGGVALGESCDLLPLNVINSVACVDDGACTLMGSGFETYSVCAAPVSLGGECIRDLQCEAGLRCSTLAPFFLTGTCEPLKENGELCGRHEECATHLCSIRCRDATLEEAYCG